MKRMLLLLGIVCFQLVNQAQSKLNNNRDSATPDSIATHRVLLDSDSKIISWIRPQAFAYDRFLRDRWNFILAGIPMSPGPAPRSNYPQYFFYCAYKDQQMIPDTWMNDIGEKIPNWFESARLYYQYSGDRRPVEIAIRLAEYSIDHGLSPANFSWPHFPYTTTNAGDTLFRGFTNSNRLVLHEVQVDHAGDMGLTYYKIYLFTHNLKFEQAAIDVANALADHAREGTAAQSVWPYRVVMKDGRVTAQYGANWMGCYSLLEQLVKANKGKVQRYRLALIKAKKFMLSFPLKTGYWTDGHSDTDVNSTTYKSNMSASNFVLYLLDHPEFDAESGTDIPLLIKWTEQNFIYHSAPTEPSTQWGANIVGEQDSFIYKMDYQTARYAAECSGWFAISGDSSFREKAFRSLNWVTYCSDSNGMAFESPLSKGITSWWSDCYGEGPRMFYPALAAVPQWAPPGQDHILYSDGILVNVLYQPGRISYKAMAGPGTDYIKLGFWPAIISLNGRRIRKGNPDAKAAVRIKPIDDGSYELIIHRLEGGSLELHKG